MRIGSEAAKRTNSELLKGAVHRSKAMSADGFLERAFTLAFRRLVYPLIWEDPVVDLEALQVKPDNHIVTIASGGCNVLSYLPSNPARITAVDLNAAHVALMRLKLVAAEQLPDHASFFRFFGAADDPENVALYDRYIKRHLDRVSRSYWEARDFRGRRRISRFSRNFYHFGLLGRFIGAGHLVAKLYGADPKIMLQAKSLEEQRELFDRELAPLFERKSVRWALRRRMSLYGLGIPPAQYEALVGDHESMAEVVKSRLERLACDFDMRDNYFAWQAFARSYQAEGLGPLPPYLEPENFAVIKSGASRVDVRQVSFTQYLTGLPAASADRYVLLDAQDWMTTADLNDLWREITRTARPGARVIFRTAAEETLLPGRVAEDVLSKWHYEREKSHELLQKDRSAIYGGFHLYVLAEPPA